jgi:3-oxoacyl-[acyl-carrier-protein] synthase-3
MKLSAKISGCGFFVPPKVVTNLDLQKWMNTSDEWIQQRTGIIERRFVEDGVGPSDLALEASKLALSKASMSANEIDLILLASLSPEHYFPGTSVFLQHKLGLQSTPCLDLRAQCSGFLYGLSVAKSMILSGQYRKILLVGTEVHSRALDMSDRGRDVACLFGDGAGAVIIEASQEPEKGIIDVVLHAQGEFADKLWVQYPDLTRTPHISSEIVESGGASPQMDGKFVFKHALTRLPQVVQTVLMRNHLRVEDIKLFLFHQANLRINDAVAQMM